MNAKAAGQAFTLLFVQQRCPQHSLCSAGYFPSKTNCPFLELCMFGVGKGMWVGKGEKVGAAAANRAVTAGRSSPVSTNTAFSYPRAFLSSRNPKIKPTLWRKSDLWYKDLWIKQNQKKKRIGWLLTVVANHAIELSTTNWSPSTLIFPLLDYSRSLYPKPSSSLSWITPGPRTQAVVRHPLSTSPGVSGWEPEQAPQSRSVQQIPKFQFISCRNEAVSFKRFGIWPHWLYQDPSSAFNRDEFGVTRTRCTGRWALGAWKKELYFHRKVTVTSLTKAKLIWNADVTACCES